MEPPGTGGFGVGSTFQSGPTQNAVFGQPAGFGAPPQGPAQRMKFGSQATGATGGEQTQPTSQGFGGFGGFGGQSSGMDADETKKKERAARFLTVSTSAIDARKAEVQQEQQQGAGEDTILAKFRLI